MLQDGERSDWLWDAWDNFWRYCKHNLQRSVAKVQAEHKPPFSSFAFREVASKSPHVSLSKIVECRPKPGTTRWLVIYLHCSWLPRGNFGKAISQGPGKQNSMIFSGGQGSYFQRPRLCHGYGIGRMVYAPNRPTKVSCARAGMYQW